MSIHGYGIIGAWENSTCGKIAVATKGGKKYFLKKYQTPVAPVNNGTLDARTIAHNQELFDRFVDLRKTVNSRIRPIAGSGGNIIIPCEEFLDGNQFVEASEFVENAVPRRELVGVLGSLSFDTKKLLMKTAAGALASVHGKHIVHSDLKLENLLLVRNDAGNYVAKLLDFDSSYPVDRQPDELVGTIDYYSPELGAYMDDEDNAEELKKNVNEKTDIFSLGLIYHFYLSGEFPRPESLPEELRKCQEGGMIIYPWIALNCGGRLRLSPAITAPKYVALISDMLSIRPEDRPTALEVLKRLQAPETSDGDPVLDEPFPAHGIVLDKTALLAAQVVRLEKTVVESRNKYKLLYRDGMRETLSKEELLEKGYAKASICVGFDGPRPEYGIALAEDILKRRGFVSGKNETVSGIQGYNLYRADGRATFFKIETLVAMGYAKKTEDAKPKVVKPVTEVFAEPWPEHKIELIPDVIKRKGYVGLSQATKDGIKGYELFRPDGSGQFIRVEMLLIQKMARKL